MKLVGPLYQRQNPCQSGGVAVTVGTRVISPFVRRKRRHISSVTSPGQAPQVAQVGDGGAHEFLGTIPHANAPVPQPIPTPKNAIGAPKPKPPTVEELFVVTLGPERVTTAGTVIRK